MFMTVVIFKFIMNFAVTDAYDTCHPGYDYSFSFRCYGEDEYCCNSDFDCCKSLHTGAIFWIIVGCVLVLGLLLFCACGARRLKNRRRPSVVMQPNQRFQVSYISYNGQSQNNQITFEQTTDPAQQGPQPPPYSTFQSDFLKPPPYSSIYAG